MKKIGICAVTAPGAMMCYRSIIEEIALKDDLLSNPEIILLQPDLMILKQAWMSRSIDALLKLLEHQFIKLESYGVDFIIIPCNTAHYVVDLARKKIKTPVYSILDVTSQFIKDKNYKNVLFLGTNWTLEGKLYNKHAQIYGYQITYPSPTDITQINNYIEHELIYFKNIEKVTSELLKIISKYTENCDSIALACTELPLAINDQNSPLPVIDTTKLLAIYAANKSIV
ncbi:aspartate/glutamate racemase family protein [Cysteiniphilum halobium]|uniref:aspartate/glutamate racemase family protein n=1 Tax=Cysteiniphilum halobium TaxID=2219059 RepID=UPI0013C31EA2|nr:amino acid racemase [Cysteiniphilum halobium]